MALHSIINKICVLASIACLGLAYLLSGYWIILFLFLAMAIFWIVMKRWSIFQSASSLLAIYMVLAAIGIALNLPVLLVAPGCVAALASWDLTNFGQEVGDKQSTETRLPIERCHLRSLAVAAFVGSILALISSYANLQIPFVVIVFLVLIAVGSLTYGLQQ